MSYTLYSHCSFYLFSKSFVFIRHALVIIDVMRPALRGKNNWITQHRFILSKKLGLTFPYMQVPKSWLSDEK